MNFAKIPYLTCGLENPLNLTPFFQFVLLGIVLISPQMISGQDLMSKTDSLEETLHEVKSDKERYELSYSLAEIFTVEHKDSIKAMAYVEACVSLGKKTGNEEWRLSAQQMKGRLYVEFEYHEQGRDLLNSVANDAREIGYSKLEASCYSYIAYNFYALRDYTEALDYLEKALKI